MEKSKQDNQTKFTVYLDAELLEKFDHWAHIQLPHFSTRSAVVRQMIVDVLEKYDERKHNTTE